MTNRLNNIIPSVSKPNTLLVDGNFLLKRSFLAKTNQYSTKFGDIGCLFSSMLTLRTIINNYNINKCIVFFDGDNGGKLRYDLYKPYKANRKNKSWYSKIELSDAQIEREELLDKSYLKQSVRFKEYLEELYIRQIEVSQIEADDLISLYCMNYHKEESILIFTNDRDILQNVHYDGVKVYLSNIKKVVSKENYFLTFNHDYKNLALMKTMCGDNSDNIIGVKGLGETNLLKYFPRIINEQLSINDVIDEAKIILDTRKTNKQKPLAVLENIINKVDRNGNELDYDVLYKIINLLEPFTTREARSELKDIAEGYIPDIDRGSKNLLRMMVHEDGFDQIWQGNITDFFKPFYPLIIREKAIYKNEIK